MKTRDIQKFMDSINADMAQLMLDVAELTLYFEAIERRQQAFKVIEFPNKKEDEIKKHIPQGRKPSKRKTE